MFVLILPFSWRRERPVKRPWRSTSPCRFSVPLDGGLVRLLSFSSLHCSSLCFSKRHLRVFYKRCATLRTRSRDVGRMLWWADKQKACGELCDHGSVWLSPRGFGRKWTRGVEVETNAKAAGHSKGQIRYTSTKRRNNKTSVSQTAGLKLTIASKSWRPSIKLIPLCFLSSKKFNSSFNPEKFYTYTFSSG